MSLWIGCLCRLLGDMVDRRQGRRSKDSVGMARLNYPVGLALFRHGVTYKFQIRHRMVSNLATAIDTLASSLLSYTF
jgi:hypothetical protein